MKSNLAQAATPYNDCDFLPSDVVVWDRSEVLFDVKYVYANGTLRITDGFNGRTVNSNEIRSATASELFHKRRLSATELSIAEVP